MNLDLTTAPKTFLNDFSTNINGGGSPDVQNMLKYLQDRQDFIFKTSGCTGNSCCIC